MPDIQIDHKIVLNNAAGENLEPYIETDSTLSTTSTKPIQNGVVATRFRDVLYFTEVQTYAPYSLIGVDASFIKQYFLDGTRFHGFTGERINGILINPNIAEANEISLTYEFKFSDHGVSSAYYPTLLTSTADGSLTYASDAVQYGNDPAATYLPKIHNRTDFYYPSWQSGSISGKYYNYNTPSLLELHINKSTGTYSYTITNTDNSNIIARIDNGTGNTSRPTGSGTEFTCWRIGGDPTYYALKGKQPDGVQVKLTTLSLTIDGKSYSFTDYINSL